MQIKKYEEVVTILKLLSNETRLKIVCALIEKSLSVSELLEKITDVTQTGMSQHLARLRKDNIIAFNREHNILRYYIEDHKIKSVIQVLYDNYCVDTKISD